jgi:pyruvate/2-oxoglutarate dehydrogenase complex dihydrolipoamide dehydrogenase (E3) component
LGDRRLRRRGAFTHTSYNDYEIVVANLFDGENRRVSDRITTYGLFIDPPLGRAGMTEAEVRKAGRKALIATYKMSSVGRARERGGTQGFMKVLVDSESRKILGVAIHRHRRRRGGACLPRCDVCRGALYGDHARWPAPQSL